MINIVKMLLPLMLLCNVLCEDVVITLESLRIQPKCEISYSKSEEFVEKLIDCFRNDRKINEEYKILKI